MFFDTNYLRGDRADLRLEQASEGAEAEYRFAVLLQDGTPAGSCSLRLGERAEGNLFFEIAPAFRGGGLAAEACRMMLELARWHGAGTLRAVCPQENEAARRVLLAAGGVPERPDGRVFRFSL